MDIKAATRTGEMPRRSVYGQLSGGPANSKICVFWLQGRCNRNPCRFMHDDSVPQSTYYRNLQNSILAAKNGRPSKILSSKSSLVSACQRSGSEEKQSCLSPEDCRPSKCHSPKSVLVSTSDRSSSEEMPQSTYEQNTKLSPLMSEDTRIRKCSNHSTGNSLAQASEESGSNSKTMEIVCQHWMLGNCVHGDSCRNLHLWFHGDDFMMLAKLQGHKKAITGIAFPSGSDKLFSGSRDGTTQLWDCHTGQCAKVLNFGAEVGCLISEGPWIFVGLPNTVKAYNIQAAAEYSLSGPVGLVYAMAVSDDTLFAGAQDGVISVWKGSFETNPFQLIAYLQGHALAVTCLFVGAKRLYSGSMDHTIRVWDLDTLQCIHTLEAHTDVIMSVLCWDQYLLSCSLDQTIKVWVATEAGNLEVTYSHNEEHGVIALCGMHDLQSKPILFCSCNDNSVHLYELPSFANRGRIFSSKEVRSIQSGPDGLFFTGDGAGMLNVWKWLQKPCRPDS